MRERETIAMDFTYMIRSSNTIPHIDWTLCTSWYHRICGCRDLCSHPFGKLAAIWCRRNYWPYIDLRRRWTMSWDTVRRIPAAFYSRTVELLDRCTFPSWKTRDTVCAPLHCLRHICGLRCRWELAGDQGRHYLLLKNIEKTPWEEFSIKSDRIKCSETDFVGEILLPNFSLLSQKSKISINVMLLMPNHKHISRNHITLMENHSVSDPLNLFH